MGLFLKVVQSAGASVDCDLSVSVAESGGSIGRSGENSLILPDLEGYVSRVHAKIEYDQGVFYVNDCSSNGTLLLEPIVDDYENAFNEVFINKCKRPLIDGGYIVIGDFEMQIQYCVDNKLPDLDTSAATPEEFNIEDFFSKDHSGVDSTEAVVRGDEDIFAGLRNPLEIHVEGVELVEHSNQTELNNSFVGSLEEKQTGGKKQAMAFSASDVAAIKKLKQARQSVTPEQTATENDSLFFQALGLDVLKLPKDQVLLAKLMTESGQMLRRLLETNMSLLKARADLKKQFLSSSTGVQRKQNNPLKHCPSIEEALPYLFLEQAPGFLSGCQAVDESVNDLYSHQMAMMAGIQAALKSTVDQFSPTVLQNGDGGRFNKSAKNWDFYVTNYKDISKQAMADFFSGDFTEAYDRQVRAMKNG